jgi:membrane protease YdiL (CAAX protease family)
MDTLLALQSCLLAPLTEELVFRSAAIRLFPRMKGWAVAVTAVLFVLAHGNLYTAFRGVLCGFVLGYGAVSYSIWWAVALHLVFNASQVILPPIFVHERTIPAGIEGHRRNREAVRRSLGQWLTADAIVT